LSTNQEKVVINRHFAPVGVQSVEISVSVCLSVHSRL